MERLDGFSPSIKLLCFTGDFMKFGATVFILAMMSAILFTLTMKYDWLRLIIYCEGFGCLGLGILYRVISFLVVVIFIVFGLWLGPKPKFLSALFAGSIASIAMLISFKVLSNT